MKIRAIAHAVPRMAVMNQDLVDRVLRRNPSFTRDQSDEVARRLTGFLDAAGARRRFLRSGGERAIDFAVAAGTSAIEQADLAPSDIDLLIFVGVGRGFVEPATAHVVQAALGLDNATCFDIMDACASWMRGLQIASQFVACGSARNALVVNCEFNVNEYVGFELDSPDAFDSVSAGFTIGEAATATIVSAGGSDDDFYVQLRSAGQFSELCHILLPHASEFRPESSRNGRRALTFYSDSKRLHFHAIQMLGEQFRSDARARDYDYDIIFGHSVSVPASRAVADRLDLDIGRHYEIFPEFGNTVSASIPLAMSLARAEGRLRRGARVLLLVASAGVSTGFATLTF